MTAARFLQIHTLHPFTAALLNRDDSGLSKRLPYGGTLRTRISSQCLKRHWRLADDPHALRTIDGAELAFRSRELVTIKVIEPLRGHFPDAVIDALEPEIQKVVYGKNGTTKKSRQSLLFGEPETNWLAGEAKRLAEEAGGNVDTVKASVKAWGNDFKTNIKVMRDNATLPGGLTAALFGRMVTSDPAANIDAPVHVAHAFSVHAEEAEGDYFTAVDDLKRDQDDSGTDTIQETELTSALFYGYVVVDIPALIKNCGSDSSLAGKVLHNLVYLIAEVSPGAKLGSTAPYSRAAFMLVEAGNRQPRSLAEAYRNAAKPELPDALNKLTAHLQKLDDLYATGETRRYLSLSDGDVPAATQGTLSELATWAQDLVGEAS